jgi:hypothetical protein
MDIKKRHKSKARQIAQRQARERVSGLERWRKAKEMAKLQATNISRTLSKTFSRRRTPCSQTEELQVHKTLSINLETNLKRNIIIGLKSVLSRQEWHIEKLPSNFAGLDPQDAAIN